MEESIIIQFKEEKYSIPIPDDLEELYSEFKTKFNIEEEKNYGFYFLKNRTERIDLTDLFRYEFSEKISLLQKEEEPIIYVEEKNKLNNIEIENNDDYDIQKNENFINEVNKCEQIIQNILEGQNQINFPNINISFGEGLKYNSDIKVEDGIKKKIKNQLQVQINELNQKFEKLKNDNKANSDKMASLLKDMEKKYEEKHKNIIGNEDIIKEDNELSTLKKKYLDLEIKYKKDMDKNKSEIDSLKEMIKDLKKENDLKQKIIEKYESDNENILEIYKKQKKLIDDMKKTE